MEVNSIKKICNLIDNLLDDYDLRFKIRQIDYCYELTIDDYTIYFEDIPYEKNKYLEINYKINNSIYIKLSRKEIIYFRIIFKSLLTNYLRYLRLSNIN